MKHLQLRYLSVMGLAACTPKEAAVSVDPPATASATATTATATVAASASATATVAASAPAPKPGFWDVTYQRTGLTGPDAKYCPTGTARCWTVTDLGATKCPATVTVACGCHPGSACFDPNAPCDAPENKALGVRETGRKPKPSCCYELPVHCVLPWQGRVYEIEPTGETEWERMAEAEHASVASFARASLELLALGAPADLVRDTHLAALDEIEHARFAFAKAGRSAGPLAIAPLRNLSIENFALAVFLEACGPETAGAEEMERRGLPKIAEDERRHADLAWRTLAWAVRESEKAREALLRAIPRVDTTDAVVRDVVIPCAWALATESRSARPG